MQLGTVIRGVVLTAALGWACAVVVAVTGARLDRAATAAARADEPVYLPRAEYLRPMSLGWQNVLADILWFRTISYFGEHYRSDRTYPWLAQMCDLVTDLDPRAEHVYRFAGFILPVGGGPGRCRHPIAREGRAAVSRLVEPRSTTSASRTTSSRTTTQGRSRICAAPMQLPDAHPIGRALVAVLASRAVRAETALAFLAELERNVDDGRSARRRAREHPGRAAGRRAASARAPRSRPTRHATGHMPLTVEVLVDAGMLPAVPSDPFGGDLSSVDPASTGESRRSSDRRASRRRACTRQNAHHCASKALRGDTGA